MGIFNFLKKRDTVIDADAISDPLLRALLNNETIDASKAMTLPAIAGAVDFIAGSIACMPVRLYKRDENGNITELKGDNRPTLLNGDTGDSLDGYQLKKAVVTDYLLNGNGYIYIERIRNDVQALKYLPCSQVVTYKSPDPFNKFFKIQCYTREVYPHEVIKLLRNTTNGAEGEGVCVQLSKAIETAYQTLLYQLSLVKSGGNKKGFLKAQRKLGSDEIDALKTAWSNMYGNNESNAIILNNGLEFQEASNTLVEMQLNESKKTLADEINDIFHISDDYYLTFKTAIYPIIKAFETALNRELLLEAEKDSLFFTFDTSETLKASLKERYEAYEKAYNIGLKTTNELRREENLNDIEGLNVLNFGLSAVLYDIDSKEFYTPNTGEIKTIDNTQEEKGAQDNEN